MAKFEFKDVAEAFAEISKQIQVFSTKLSEKARLAIVYDLTANFAKELENEWLAKLKEKLNDPLPKHLRHKVRQPRSRLFPYRDTGKMRDNISIDIDVNRLSENHFQVIAWFEMATRAAFYTNYGKPAPKEVPEGKWKDWAKDVLLGNGRAGVKSAKVIFNEYFSAKRLNSLIQKEVSRMSVEGM